MAIDLMSLKTDEKYEEDHLAQVRVVIEENCKRYSESLKDMEETIQSLDSTYKEESGGVFRSGDAATWLQMSNTIAMYEQTRLSLTRAERAKNKPYFGRIIFTEKEKTSKDKQAESLYIGRSAVAMEGGDQCVVDWRAPISNVYYENGLGLCEYQSPEDGKISVDLSLKRTYDIEDCKLVGFFDSEVASNDDLLNKYLARNKQSVLGEIIATIQKEQNDIIRKSPLKNILVQGVAGSGKTTVAMHRISYILYNYRDRIKPEDFYIIGSNRMLLNYITGVLPELDVSGFRQLTMEQMFVRLLYTDWDTRMFEIAESDPKDPTATLRGSSVWFGILERFLDEKELTFFEEKLSRYHRPEYMKFPGYNVELFESRGRDYCFNDLLLNPYSFNEGLEKGKTGIYDRTSSKQASQEECLRLLGGRKIAEFVSGTRRVSLRNKLATIRDWLTDNMENEFIRAGVSMTAREKDAARRHFAGAFAPEKTDFNVYDLYDEFLGYVVDNYEELTGCSAEAEGKRDFPAGRKTLEDKDRIIRGLRLRIGEGFDPKKVVEKRRAFDVYDLACLAYIYKRIVEEEEISEAHHIVVDEAQDYGMMAYRALEYCVKDCRYTVMGDIAQNIRYESGINDWQELKELLLTDRQDSFCTLRKSYRNTIEISEFATDILKHGSFEIYPAEPIIRHGKAPELMQVDRDGLYVRMVNVIKGWQKEGLETIAVVCRDSAEAANVSAELSKKISLLENKPEEAEFGAGVMVLPVNMTKGLEFDAVLIFNPTKKAYPSDDTNVKLLYVAATRALHELTIVYCDKLTGLLTDEISEDRRRELKACEERLEAERLKQEHLEKLKTVDTSYDEEREKEYVKAKILRESQIKTESYLKNRTESSTSCKEKMQPVQPVAVKEAEIGRQFATVPPDRELQVPGHALINQAIRWVVKQADGFYFQSRYGVLRICPIGKSTVRISFKKGTDLQIGDEGVTRRFAMLKGVNLREKGNTAELALPELTIVVDKLNGCLSIKNKSGKEIFSERKTEPRYADESGKGLFTYFNITSSESFNIYDHANNNLKYLHNTAYYLNPDSGEPPFIIKKDCYGLLLATKKPAIFCQRGGYGTFAKVESDVFDMYFCASQSTEELLSQYEKFIL